MKEAADIPLHKIRQEEFPISYRYLEFETEIPSLFPNPQLFPAFYTDNLPPPNLKKYESPYDWSPARKYFITTVSCISTLFASFAASCYSPGVEQMSAEWKVSDVAVTVGITTFTSGFAVGPMFLAPISEVVGRKNVFVATAFLFTICQLCCAVTRIYPGMLVARFFAGIGGSTFSTMVGGIVADIFRAKDRNIPMALFSGSALFGTALGPLVSSFIAQYTTWRWIFYMQIAIGSVITIAVVLFFKETRGPTVLRNKADALNRWYLLLEGKGYHLLGGPGEGTGSSKTGSSQPPFVRIRWKGAADDNRATLVRMITTSVQRPFVMLLTEPVVFFFSLWAAFSWSVLYINLSVIPLVFENVYGFSLIASDAQFTAAAVGSVLAMFLSIFQDTLAERRDGWNTTPEHRLYFSCVESVLLPIGLFMFGWSSQYHVHWIVPSLAVGLSTMGIFSIYLAVFNYLADTYHRYASSALAAQSFCRNVLGGIFPLVSKQMFENLGFGAAASLLGGIATGLTFVPWVLVFLGPKIRAQSKLASELSK